MSRKISEKERAWMFRFVEDRVFAKIEKQWHAHGEFDSDALLEELAVDNAAATAEFAAKNNLSTDAQRKVLHQYNLHCWVLINDAIEQGELPPFKREHMEGNFNMH